MQITVVRTLSSYYGKKNLNVEIKHVTEYNLQNNRDSPIVQTDWQNKV